MSAKEHQEPPSKVETEVQMHVVGAPAGARTQVLTAADKCVCNGHTPINPGCPYPKAVGARPLAM